MIGYRSELPDPNAAARSAIYRGEIFHLGATPASVALVDDVNQLLTAELATADPRRAQAELGDDRFFEAIGRVRRTLYLESHFHDRVFAVTSSLGFDPAEVAFDPVRLRVVSHLGHTNPRAAPIYYAHRDTWFSLSQSVIAWWIAMHDIAEEETFHIFPEWLERPVANDSEKFDYDEWRRDPRQLKIGWQDRNAGMTVHYSGAKEDFDPGAVVPLAASRGDNVLFSGAHLHRTRGHASGITRFSLDFRMVHRDDHARGLGPKNVDNRSRGSAISDYIRR